MVALSSLSAQAKDAALLYYRINSSVADFAFRGNSSFSSRVASFAVGEKTIDNIRRVHVRAAASPDGPLAFNRKLASARAWATVDLIKEILPSLPDSLYSVSMVDEDWAGLTGYLRRCDKPWKEDALKIVNSGRADREDRLRELYVGEAWEDLAANCFPLLRKAEVTVEYDQPLALVVPATPVAAGSDHPVLACSDNPVIAGCYPLVIAGALRVIAGLDRQSPCSGALARTNRIVDIPGSHVIAGRVSPTITGSDLLSPALCVHDSRQYSRPCC